MLFITPWIICQAILFVAGGYWCYEVVGRWRSDLAELREVQETERKFAIIGLWIVTAIIALLDIYFAWGVVSAIIRGIRAL